MKPLTVERLPLGGLRLTINRPTYEAWRLRVSTLVVPDAIEWLLEDLGYVLDVTLSTHAIWDEKGHGVWLFDVGEQQTLTNTGTVDLEPCSWYKPIKDLLREVDKELLRLPEHMRSPVVKHLCSALNERQRIRSNT